MLIGEEWLLYWKLFFLPEGDVVRRSLFVVRQKRKTWKRPMVIWLSPFFVFYE